LSKRRKALDCILQNNKLDLYVKKVVPKIINRRLKRSASKNIRESQFGFGNGKTTRESIGLMHNEYREDLHKTMYLLEKVFDRVNLEK
jgi:hypothetical protein